MADQRDTLTVIAEEIAFALQPLTAAFSSTGALRDFLEELGWDFATPPAAVEALRAPAEAVLALVESREGGVDSSLIADLLEDAAATFNAINQLKSGAGLPNDFKNEFPAQLVQFLLVEYLRRRRSKLGFLLIVLGIIRLEEIPSAGSRPAYLKRVFAFSDFNQLFGDPLVFFKNGYSWGQSDFRGEPLLENVHALMDAWGLRTYQQTLDPNTLGELASGALQPDEAFDTALRLIFVEASGGAAELSAGVGLYLLPETTNAKPGFSLQPFATGEFSQSFALTDFLELSFEGEVDLSGGVGVLVRPDRDVEIFVGLESGTPSAISGTLGVVLRLANPGEPFVLLGTPDASRLQVAGASTKGGTRFHSSGDTDVFVEFALEQGKIVIKPGGDEADGFLAQLLPGDGMEIDFDLTTGFSTSQGLYFSGSGGLEISIPAHIQLGPIEIESALVAVRPKPASGSEPFKIPVELATTFKADFGVLKGTVENIGMSLDFAFPDEGDGNLGPLDLSLGFRPPNGVGLAVDAGVVKGGGYLYFDFEKEEYAGALELVFSEFLTLKAIGLITTRMPDGSKGFSLLIIITAEFGSPIQLGFGFTLIGVGGLLGLNRTMRLEVIAEGVRTGSVESIMFPRDVIENAPRIISDLRDFFPPAADRFLIGPMAKLGWGTPTLVSASLGVIIEIPPGNIAILGVLKLALPDEDLALIVIQVNFIGALEPEKKRLWFFASMYESRVLFITLEGEMGLLVAWGEDANFVLSVGGFHPSFNPPVLPFPNPKRIAINILNESFARVRVEGYFAVTSNTVQFGARVEIFFGLSEFKIEGHIAFDALFQFSPFYFIISMSASLGVKVFGVGLFSVHMRGELEGTSPWHIEGEGSISILFFSIDVPFSHTWGQSEDTTLPPIAVMPLLEAEFNKLENWTAELPSANNLLVSLREIEATEDLVLHPVGVLRVTQRAVPLDLDLDKIGNQIPNDVKKIVVEVPGADLEKHADTEEQFATAQFKDLSDSQKLSKPAYEEQQAGIELSVAGDQLTSGAAVKRTVRYEEIIIDNNFKEHLKRFVVFAFELFTHFLRGNAVSRSTLSASFAKQKAPIDQKIAVQLPLYVVASNANNVPVSAQAQFASQAKADDFMREQIASEPKLADTLHVIPATEMRDAA